MEFQDNCATGGPWAACYLKESPHPFEKFNKPHPGQTGCGGIAETILKFVSLIQG